MEQRFIKYKPEQVNLVKLYEVSTGCVFDNNDLQDGTLVVGYYCEGKYLAMGYLRAMYRRNTVEVDYEIVNAIEGEVTSNIQAPHRVNVTELPFLAATSPDVPHPVVGRIYKCNGELAVMDSGFGKVTVNVNSVLELVPYFKEDNNK